MHGHLPFTKEQFQAGHVDVVMPLKEFGYNRSNNLWLKDKLCQMAKKSIDIPYKMNDTTYYKHFDSLFTPDFYKSSNGLWMVNLRFDYALMQYLFAFDKGVTTIDLNAMDKCTAWQLERCTYSCTVGQHVATPPSRPPV